MRTSEYVLDFVPSSEGYGLCIMQNQNQLFTQPHPVQIYICDSATLKEKAYIAKYNTHCILNSLEQSNNPFIHQYKEYFMIYHTIPYFQICYYWILSDKKETPQELFQMIKQLQKQS